MLTIARLLSHFTCKPKSPFKETWPCSCSKSCPCQSSRENLHFDTSNEFLHLHSNFIYLFIYILFFINFKRKIARSYGMGLSWACMWCAFQRSGDGDPLLHLRRRRRSSPLRQIPVQFHLITLHLLFLDLYNSSFSLFLDPCDSSFSLVW